MLIEEFKALLDLFEAKVPDRESNRLVWELCGDRASWANARRLHSTLRARNLEAIKLKDQVRQCQYCFEEVVVATLFNLTAPNAPFDSDTPYWVLKNALVLAKSIGVSVDAVADIVAPGKRLKIDSPQVT